MKKFISVLIISNIITLCFAQTYQDLMQKAKNAENENNWISALGYYFDAAHATDAQQEAENRYIEIKNTIESGKPGLNNINDIFETDDKWDDLRKDFIKYFTENSPWTFYLCNTFERINLDKVNKTADYKLYYVTGISRKYRLFREIVQKGMPEKVELFPGISTDMLTDAETWTKEWYDVMPKKIEEIYNKTGLAYYLAEPYSYGSKEQKYLYGFIKNKDLSKKSDSFEELMSTAFDANEAYTWKSQNFIPFATSGIYADVKLYEGQECIYEEKEVFIDCKDLYPFYNKYDYGNMFEYNSNGAFVEISKDYSAPILLKNVPQNIVNKIESGSVTYNLENAFIPYGFECMPKELGRIKMKLEKISTAEATRLDFGDGYRAKNKDIRYGKEGDYNFKSYSDDLPESYFKRNEAVFLYQTNIFGEIISIMAHTRYGNIDKKMAQKIIAEMKIKGWYPLENNQEDYFTKKRDIYSNLPSPDFYWTEETLNNKKIKGERQLLLKKEIKD